MKIRPKKIAKGYENFRKKYLNCERPTMQKLMHEDQKPEVMMISCCDSRVDPSIIFECEPGDLFAVRNIGSIVPPYEKDNLHHGTSAALEFGVKFLGIKHLIILGHSNCGGISALRNDSFSENDFITNWVNIVEIAKEKTNTLEECIKATLRQSYKHCMTFPWIKEKIDEGFLTIHVWFFDLQTGTVNEYDDTSNSYKEL